jgi:histone-lysine N-methyltransferase SETD2
MPIVKMEGDKSLKGESTPVDSPRLNGIKSAKGVISAVATPDGSNGISRASSISPDESKPGSNSADTPDNSNTPRLSRKSSQKVEKTPPKLFDHLPDDTGVACDTFQVINDCLYGSKHMGSSEHDALDCDCAEEWRKYLKHRPLLGSSGR